MKKLLLLAWYFPPRNHIAAYRSGCFAKFLPENGWLPSVVCEEWPADRLDYDPDFVGIIPEQVRIHRIPNPRPKGFHERVILRKLGPYLWPRMLPIPWSNRALKLVREMVKAERFDAIWATSPSITPLSMASQISKETGLPWLADIRDSINVQRTGSWYKRPIFCHLERQLCRSATRVVTVSRGIASELGGMINREITVIPNGFDPTLLPQQSCAPLPRFRIAYAGALLLPQRNPAPLLKAVELCLQRELIPRDLIEVAFYGSDPELIESAFPDGANRVPLTVHPRIAHKEVLRVLMDSSVLLLLSHAGETGVLTGKVFDYLAAGRPILAVPDDHGETSSLIRRTGAGAAVTEVEAIVRQLVVWFSAWKNGTLDAMRSARNEVEIARYSRREQTKQLASILDQMTAHQMPQMPE